MLSQFLPNIIYGQFWKRHHKKHRNSVQRVVADSTSAQAMPWHEQPSRKELKHRRRELARELRHANKTGHRVKPKPRVTDRPAYHTTSRRRTKGQNGLPRSVIKKRYRVAILAPVYFDELFKGHGQLLTKKIPEKAIAGLGFYQGTMIAVDSLKKINANLDFVFHDVTSKHEKLDSLIANKQLDSFDLIIGALPPQDLQQMSSFCHQHKINFISAMSPADGAVKQDPLFTILQPTLKTHCDYLMRLLAKKYKGRKVIWLCSNKTLADENAMNYISTDSSGQFILKRVLWNRVPHKKDFEAVHDTGTVVILASLLDNMFVDSVLREMSAYCPDQKFEVYGMPSWTGLNLQRRSGSYPNISFYLTLPFDIDTDNPTAKYVQSRYRQHYDGTPSEMVYRGYEAVVWPCDLLRRYGTVFNGHWNNLVAAPFTLFKVILQHEKNGDVLYNENKHIYFMHYQSGSVTLMQ